jgi:hypothetical protein
MQNITTVSNSDIVTMLAVKNRKIIEEKIVGLYKRRAELHDIKVAQFKEAHAKAVASLNPRIVASFLELHQLLNPGVPVKVTPHIREYYDLYNRAHAVIDMVTFQVHIDVEDDDDEYRRHEANFQEINRGELQVHLKRIMVEFPTNVVVEADDVDKELHRLNMLLKDESKLKDELVAQMTAHAITQNAELAGMVDSIKLLS